MAARRCSWWLLVAARLLRTLAEPPPCGPVDCAELACWGITRPAVQQVFAPGSLWLTCDFVTAGGGWTVLQKRRNQDFDFYRTWSEYKQGFGVHDTLWLGLDHVHRLTRGNLSTLRIELEVGHPSRLRHIEYEDFSVGSEADYFRLQLGRPVANKSLPDELRNHTGPFCTWDSPDNAFCRHEAMNFHTGWWFSRKRVRLGADLNSKMLSRLRQERVYWRGVSGIMTTAMKFRPLAFSGGQQRLSCDKTCPNGGTCRRNTYSRFQCDCSPGYDGRQCQHRIPGHFTVSDYMRSDQVLSWMLLVFGVLALVGMVVTPLHAWFIYVTARNSRRSREDTNDERTYLVHKSLDK